MMKKIYATLPVISGLLLAFLLVGCMRATQPATPAVTPSPSGNSALSAGQPNRAANRFASAQLNASSSSPAQPGARRGRGHLWWSSTHPGIR